MTPKWTERTRSTCAASICADKMGRRDRHRKYPRRERTRWGWWGPCKPCGRIIQSLPPIQQEQVKSILASGYRRAHQTTCSRTELIEGAKNPQAAEQLFNSLIKHDSTSRSDHEEESYYELSGSIYKTLDSLMI